MECIVLAGGLGTRLKSVVADLPKCMAPVSGEPFLHHLFTYLEQNECTRVILSLGYKHESILEWLKEKEWDFEIAHVVEEEPLGTGGGVLLALKEAKEDNVVILNGDTMFRLTLRRVLDFHKSKKAVTTLALKPMQNFERYGVVNMDKTGAITSFEEKKHYKEGLINGGIYIVDRKEMLSMDWPVKFSLEKDYFEKHVQGGGLYGFVSDAYFIDIGIPEDYKKAQKDFK